MTKTKKEVGKLGEEVAADYLVRIGYKIIEKNFQKRYGEIDIIAKDGDVLVFVEVKTRKGNWFGAPEESITSWKLKSLVKSAYYYKYCHPRLPEDMRIDLVAVTLKSSNEVQSINLYKNITG